MAKRKLKLQTRLMRQVKLDKGLLAIVVGVVSLAGWYFLAKSMAAQSVRFVRFCAQGISCAYSTSTVDTYSRDVQNWYSSRVGSTFGRSATVTVTGREHYSYYSGSTDTVYYRIRDEIRAQLGSGGKIVALTGFRSLSNCGAGTASFGVVDPYRGCNIGAALAHELGHTFGMGHTGRSGSNLMSGSTDGSYSLYPCSGATLGNCTLNSSQVNHLRSKFATSSSGNTGSGGGGTTSSTAPKVTIYKTDDRAISNLRIYGYFYINGYQHYDWEDLGNFNYIPNLRFYAHGMSWNGERYVGNMLYRTASASGGPHVVIRNEDGRAVRSVQLAAYFYINGYPHYDWEDIGDWNGNVCLHLNGYGGSWNGSYYSGNFLRRC